jgi:hypothetical protein
VNKVGVEDLDHCGWSYVAKKKNTILKVFFEQYYFEN